MFGKNLKKWSKKNTNLLLEVTNGVVISIREEVANVLFLDRFFEMIHQSCTVALGEGEMMKYRTRCVSERRGEEKRGRKKMDKSAL
jgi:hypothetical protein